MTDHGFRMGPDIDQMFDTDRIWTQPIKTNRILEDRPLCHENFGTLLCQGSGSRTRVMKPDSDPVIFENRILIQAKISNPTRSGSRQKHRIQHDPNPEPWCSNTVYQKGAHNLAISWRALFWYFWTQERFMYEKTSCASQDSDDLQSPQHTHDTWSAPFDACFFLCSLR